MLAQEKTTAQIDSPEPEGLPEEGEFKCDNAVVEMTEYGDARESLVVRTFLDYSQAKTNSMVVIRVEVSI